MARIEKGNSLRSLILQPGYTIHNDGYGLLTCTATFKVDGDPNKQKLIKRGTVFPHDPRLTCHKSSQSFGALGVSVVTADYVGIAEGEWTMPNVSGSASLTTESITSHPSFFQKTTSVGGKKTTTSSTAIAGNGPYVTAFSVTELKPYKTIYEGNHGAIFEQSTGGKFLGFYSKANSDARKLYQRTSYLAPTSVYHGTLYTTKATNCIKLKEFTGKTMSARAPQGMRYLLPDYFGDDWSAADEDPQLMIANVHFEDYGTVYKLTYEIRYNAEGYSRIVYDKSNI